MSIRISYYPGCSGKGTSSEYETSTTGVCQALDVDLVEIPDWSCCGSTPAHTVNHVLSSALSARNLTLAEQEGFDTVTTPCPSCLSNLKIAEHKMRKESFREAVNELLDQPYGGGVDTKSVLQVLVENVGLDKVRERVKTPLEGLKVACYYGCIMNRPPEVMDFDDHEHPMAMDNLMEAIGAEVIPFPLKVECCGASFGIPQQNIVTTLSGKLLEVAKGLGVDALVTACPLCQMNLDLRQGQINAAQGTQHSLPIFYFTQLMAKAFDLSDAVQGMKRLIVNPQKALAKIGQADKEIA
ncbi:CoB--CoM heterodisulfide reductase iron-sulfur subunit B family protein [Desulforhopalus singaporensis]|uniref:Heterodisulfide reductase subunit B n=1 Tax=Desulforhopalus singaporensis TaxID=91360 RepID=A0A1H0SQ00_9BACT|nr:CoB--CoM heterodisulfide reductase iron-sulfur subunit B family protein [Desulforhopalus singaporensis]SDP43852.1 heterodisulfide reductase subunit B [Desulforhopalus singaporensis]